MIRNAKELDREITQQFSLVVAAKDSKSSKVKIIINNGELLINKIKSKYIFDNFIFLVNNILCFKLEFLTLCRWLSSESWLKIIQNNMNLSI